MSPATAELTALGATVQLSAEVRDQNGQVMAGATVTWASSAAAVATVSASGLVTAVANGSATITATAGSVSGSATVTVAQEVSTVAVAPDTATVLEGDTLRMAATATDANGQVVTGAEFTWASADTAVAVVDSTGLVTGVAAGQVQVTATAAGLTGRAELAVVTPLPTTVAVTPDTVVLTAVGQTAQLTAEVRDQAGRVMEGVPVVWLSAETTVAAVDTSGLVTAVGGGAVTITATAGEASGDALVTVEIDPDRAALVALYNATDGPNWVDNTNWLTDAPLGEWYGVSTNAEGRVVRIILSEHGLRGELPAELANLTELTNLSLWRNDLTGPIPPELGNLTELSSLGLVFNGLTGPIPPELGNLTELSTLHLGFNGLTGAIPPELGKLVNLETLTLWANDLAGPIPPELGDLSSLVSLELKWNQLTGEIPPELGNLTELSSLSLGFNGLTGPIPSELGNLAALEHLYLERNDLTGPIPSELGDLAALEHLNLNDNELTGPIPPQLGNLAKLQVLDLSQNDLTGRIPPELGSLGALVRLQLGNNYQLTGPIPPELGNLANLEWLWLGWSNLGGPIPPELGNLSELQWLNLYRANLTGPIPPELGNLTELINLELGVNGLTGPIPPELGNLAALTSLGLGSINLTGPVPRSFLQLNQLRWFFVSQQNVCVPGTSAFAVWFEGIESRDANSVFCNAAEVAVLESLYRGTGGADWTASGGWLGNHGVGDWYGVTADSLGHVTGLDLDGNGLTGRLPAVLGDVSRMTVLRIADNALSGRIPRSLTALPLVQFRYSQTELCAPTEVSFQSWLNGITSLEGTGVNCEPPSSDRDVLEILYHETGGPNWTNNGNWLTDAPLRNWYGVDVDGEGRVSGLSLVANDFVGNNLIGRIPPELSNLTELTELSLANNNLTGPIPPELGDLAALNQLLLYGNNLTGPIPAELGDLAVLSQLHLYGNNLTGPIPPELGNLAALRGLSLGPNNLTGPIPPELGNLAALWVLGLGDNNLTGRIPPELGNLAAMANLGLEDNNLTGPIPPELGNLANLWWLSMGSNNLSGPVPPELGALTGLEALVLANNLGLAGALPQSLTGLDRLRELHAGSTGLCAPTDAAFQAWLGGVQRFRIAQCTAGEPPAAYLTQAVQSREFPVPLVAGERPLLRVFPTAGRVTSEGIPLVRARFYVRGQETHVQDIPGKSDLIPTEVDEGDLSRSANAEIPAWVIQPGLEMVIEVDPDGTLDPGLGVGRRIPETGRLGVDVKAMPPFDLTLIPFIWTATHDSSIVDLVGAMAAGPEHHEMLGETRTLMPIADLAVTAHEAVLVSSNSAFALLSQTDAIRVMEGGTGHYMGMSFPPPGSPIAGVAHRGGRSSYSSPQSGVIAHELGHNLSLGHAPCLIGRLGGLDPLYPHPGGTTGAWGYDFRNGRLVSPQWRDLMTCGAPQWISDYHFTNALQYRLVNEGTGAAAVSASTRSLLLWGGMRADSVPYLEPTFVVDAPAALPDSAGEYRVTGRTAGGGDLFSFSFTMPVTVDGDGSSSFAFALPVRAGWEGSLATITLSGPERSVTLDRESDIPMAILRDPRTGQVRGILRDPPLATEVAADAIGVSAPGLEVLFSRGIPGGGAWRR